MKKFTDGQFYAAYDLFCLCNVEEDFVKTRRLFLRHFTEEQMNKFDELNDILIEVINTLNDKIIEEEE